MDATHSRNSSRARTPAWLLLALLGAGLAGGGCAYGGMAALPDGSVLIARNSLFGGLRKIYVCKVNAGAMSCVETTNAP